MTLTWVLHVPDTTMSKKQNYLNKNSQSLGFIVVVAILKF